MHSAAESARWSNCPGRNSVANTVRIAEVRQVRGGVIDLLAPPNTVGAGLFEELLGDALDVIAV